MAAVVRTQIRDRGPGVRLDSLRRRLLYVLHVVEVLVSFAYARRAAEVVEGDRGRATLGEAQCELFVEAIQPAHVRQDDDADAGRLVRRGRESGEAVAVRRFE